MWHQMPLHVPKSCWHLERGQVGTQEGSRKEEGNLIKMKQQPQPLFYSWCVILFTLTSTWTQAKSHMHKNKKCWQIKRTNGARFSRGEEEGTGGGSVEGSWLRNGLACAFVRGVIWLSRLAEGGSTNGRATGSCQLLLAWPSPLFLTEWRWCRRKDLLLLVWDCSEVFLTCLLTRTLLDLPGPQKIDFSQYPE